MLRHPDSPAAPLYLSKEIGLNRYERIEGHDFSAGDEYWERTGRYWQAVRDAWRQRYAALDRLQVAGSVDEVPLVVRHFEEAEASVDLTDEEIAAQVEATLDAYVSVPSGP